MPSAARGVVGPGLIPAERWPEGLQDGVAQLRAAGIDLVHAFRAVEVSQAFPEPPAVLRDRGPEQVGLVLGNTRALWTPFCASPEAQSARRQALEQAAVPHPLDAYVERVLAESLGHRLASGGVAYGQLTGSEPLPLQRIATLAGLTHTGPCQLNLHPIYGTWIGLRAVLVLESNIRWRDLSFLAEQQAPQESARCYTCTAPCVAAFEQAMQMQYEALPRKQPDETWPLSARSASWLQVRQICPVGGEFAYGPRQTQYHYDKVLKAIGPEPGHLSRER